MARFTVYRNPDGNGYLLDLQADINGHFSTRVVAPLLTLRDIADYAKTLNPVTHGGRTSDNSEASGYVAGADARRNSRSNRSSVSGVLVNQATMRQPELRAESPTGILPGSSQARFR